MSSLRGWASLLDFNRSFWSSVVSAAVPALSAAVCVSLGSLGFRRSVLPSLALLGLSRHDRITRKHDSSWFVRKSYLRVIRQSALATYVGPTLTAPGAHFT